MRMLHDFSLAEVLMQESFLQVRERGILLASRIAFPELSDN
jgi:hypothetical protein